jgi:hypothetical protein
MAKHRPFFVTEIPRVCPRHLLEIISIWYPNNQLHAQIHFQPRQSIALRFPLEETLSHHEKNTALGSNGLPVLGSIPFFSILAPTKILRASSNPTFLTAIIRLIAALSPSSSPALVSPDRILSDKSNVALEKPSSKSVANDPGRNRGRGIYGVDRANHDLNSVRLGIRWSQRLRVK